MSKKFAHERNNARDRVRAKDQKSREERAEQKKRSDECQVIEFGKYARKKMSPAELSFADLGYFFWATRQGAFHGWRQVDAEEIVRRCKHIKPPKRKAGNWRFLLEFDSRNKLRGLELVPASTKQRIKEGQFLSKHLDLRWLLDPESEFLRHDAKMLSMVKSILFGSASPSKWVCKEFWSDERRFALDCRETHCPSIRVHSGLYRPIPRYDGTEYA